MPAFSNISQRVKLPFALSYLSLLSYLLLLLLNVYFQLADFFVVGASKWGLQIPSCRAK